jgi:hypothetical protein
MNLYRGNWSGNHLRAPVFTTPNRNEAKQYGPVTHYRLKNGAILIDMTDPAVIMNLKRNATPEVRQAINKAFRIVEGQVRRFSKLKYDIVVARHVCMRGYNGYITPRMRTKGPSGYFHPEVLVCNPEMLVKIGRTNNTPAPPRLRR